MLEKLKIKITIVATLIVTLYAYLYNDNFLKTCYAIIITIIVFYFLGGFIEIFLKNQIEKIKKAREQEKEKEKLEIEEIQEIENIEEMDIDEDIKDL